MEVLLWSEVQQWVDFVCTHEEIYCIFMVEPAVPEVVIDEKGAERYNRRHSSPVYAHIGTFWQTVVC